MRRRQGALGEQRWKELLSLRSARDTQVAKIQRHLAASTVSTRTKFCEMVEIITEAAEQVFSMTNRW